MAIPNHCRVETIRQKWASVRMIKMMAKMPAATLLGT